MLFAISDFGDFILTSAAMFGALATIVASVRVLGHIKPLAAIGRALVGDPLKRFIHGTVAESPLAQEVHELAQRTNEIEAHQEQSNGDVRDALERNTAAIESLRRKEPPQT